MVAYPIFTDLEDIANVAALSKQECAQYDESVKVYRDYLATMDAAKIEGRQKGLEEGRQEGISRAASNMKKITWGYWGEALIQI